MLDTMEPKTECISYYKNPNVIEPNSNIMLYNMHLFKKDAFILLKIHFVPLHSRKINITK